MLYKKYYDKWLNDQYFDDATREELRAIAGDEKEIEDRFYKNLEFGTAGLRGKIGAGTNRMNKYVIARTTQGLAQAILEAGDEAKNRGVAIAYDSRHYSDVFAKTAALVLAANGIKAYLFDSLRPTPLLSYAVRELNAISGIVITASHNPKEYNGYKVYWEDGAQILKEIADDITDKIYAIDDYSTIPDINEKDAIEKGLLVILDNKLDDEYVERVKALSVTQEVDKDVRVVFTPFNGTGNVLVRRVLKEQGFTNIIVVKEQENPDPDFTTVGYPNPENVKAFEYAIKLGNENNADILIGTDPDCDRVGLLVNNKGEYVSFNGNQIGVVLINYILEARVKNNNLPKNGAIIKSIVTGDLGKRIAKDYGVETFDVLTGFKNICSKINEFEEKNNYEFIFGYEESMGYLYGSFVRDKDAVVGSMLICEAAGYYKLQGKTLLDVLNEVYKKYGYYKEELISVSLEGIEGMEKIKSIMADYSENYPLEIGDMKLKEYYNFNEQIHVDLNNNTKNKLEYEKSEGLKFIMEDNTWYAIRPSGTEPKIKLYIYGIGTSEEEADLKIKTIKQLVLAKFE